jgi:hypothetical protein
LNIVAIKGYGVQLSQLPEATWNSRVVFDSSILSQPQKNQLTTWLPQSMSNCTLLYRGSVHGFETSQFHSRCDGKGATLAVVRSTSNHIFGGYTSKSWDSSDQWVRDNESWLFTLTYNGPAQFKANPRDALHVSMDRTHFPRFGRGHDLFIRDGCNAHTHSYSCVSDSFDVQGRAVGQTSLCDPKDFQVSEIEVFQVI